MADDQPARNGNLGPVVLTKDDLRGILAIPEGFVAVYLPELTVEPAATLRAVEAVVKLMRHVAAAVECTCPREGQQSCRRCRVIRRIGGQP